VVDIAIDPRGTTDQTIFAAFGSGGVWKSTDDGNTWAPKTDGLLSLSTGAVALDPGNPSIVYVGTDNPAFGGDCPGCNFTAVGIYKSLDGGNTWTLLPNSPTGVAIRRIVFPAPGVLLVATTQGLYRSLDAGATFSRLTVSGFAGNGIDDIRLDTQNPKLVRVSIGGLGIFVSTDATLAAPPTFTNLWTASNGSPLQNPVVTGGHIGFIAFAQSTTGGVNPPGQTIYATVQNTTPTTLAPSQFLGMWVSTDGGGTAPGRICRVQMRPAAPTAIAAAAASADTIRLSESIRPPIRRSISDSRRSGSRPTAAPASAEPRLRSTRSIGTTTRSLSARMTRPGRLFISARTVA
jgi:hypothetical protein